MIGWIIYSENETEIVSERNEVNRFVEEAEEEGIHLRVLKPEQIDLFVTSQNRKSILVDGEITTLPDFVLPRMGAGTTYFALAVIRHLERLGVPCINSSDPIEIVKDKLYTQQILAENNFPVPKTMLAKFPINIDLIEKNIGFPAVIKTLSGTQGKGVFLSDTKKSFKDLMQLIEITNSKVNIIIQEFIKDSYGRDLRVLIIGGRAVACMERVAQEDGFKANFSDGGIVKEYELTPEIEWLATEACKVTGLEIAGVDLLFDGDHYKICEINSSPGFRGIESCCDINVAKEIFKYLKIRFGIFK
ncbi:ATP-grasp domain-containing protein [Clostridium ganghwense]|uniref:RimK family alpha-L-glutamate ligase n=1 Tax=Clostridium ganghwense TaxID=312089 RepID=A0ABT4CMB7_9CLOT|nr:RimK family alpha-L-glutamate ligase [Clostridium ganghwense]MCY6370185.1 RimK family alpha-L-glutamate ligase [Clostridium ganghwense]